MDAKQLACSLAASRVAIGAALVAAPGLMTRGWIGALRWHLNLLAG